VPDSYTNLVSSATIREVNELDISYDSPYGEGVLDQLAQVSIPYRKNLRSLATSLGLGINLPSTVFIPYWHNFFSRGQVTENNWLDVSFDVPRGIDDLIMYNKAIIPSRDDIFGQGFVEPAHVDFTNSAYNPHLNIVHKGSAGVTESVPLDIRLVNIAPPITTIELPGLKDAYIRESKPSINYGSSQSLIAGRGVDGEYRTYIEFDLLSLKDILDMNIVDVELIIDKLDATDGHLEIYECHTRWAESRILWYSYLEHSEEPILSGDFYGTSIKFNVRELILELLESGRSTLNIMIKSDDVIIMKSRESGVPAKLVLQYTDPNWNGFIDELDLTNKAIIRAISKKDIYSSYRLVERLFKIGSAIFKNGRDFESRADIIKSSIPSRSDLFHSTDNSGSGIVNAQGSSDLYSRYNHNNLNGVSFADVPHRRDLFSRLTIPPEKQVHDFDGKLDIIRTYVFSLVEVVRSIYMGGAATVRVSSEEDLLSSARIMNEVISGSAHPSLRSISYGSVIVKRSEAENLLSNLDVATPYLYSNYALRRNLEMVGSAIMNGTEIFDTLSKGDVATPNLPSRYALRKRTFIGGRAYVKTQAFDEIFSSTSIPENTHIGAKVVNRVSSVKDISAGAVLRRSGVLDNYGGADVPNRTDIFSDSTIRMSSTSNLPNRAVLRRSDILDLTGYSELILAEDLASLASLRKLGNLDGFGEVIVRREGVDHLPSVLSPLLGDDKSSWMYRRRSWRKDLSGSSTIRRESSTDLGNVLTPHLGNNIPSQVVRRRYDTDHLDSASTVRRSDDNNLPSSAGFAKTSHFNGSANIFQVSQMRSSAVRRQIDVAHTSWEAFVEGGFYRSHRESFANIRLISSFNRGFATIESGARTWRPNVEGELDFEDRKLPRIWRRSDFII